MRIIAISLCALALAAPALAASQTTQPVPMPIVTDSVPVEVPSQTLVAQYNNAGEARAACVASHGTFSATAGRLRCADPTTPLQPSIGRIDVLTGGASSFVLRRDFDGIRLIRPARGNTQESVLLEVTGQIVSPQYGDANEARADCIRARGTFRNTAGRLVCSNSRR